MTGQQDDTPRPARRSGRGLTPLRAMLPEAATREIRRRGFFEVAVISRWSVIVCPDIAGCCVPERIAYPRGQRSGATLHLVVSSARAIEVQHMEPVLIERINTVFGYDAVARLALHHGLPESVRPGRRRPRPLEPEEEEWVDRQVARVRDGPLREALLRLGRAVLGSTDG